MPRWRAVCLPWFQHPVLKAKDVKYFYRLNEQSFSSDEKVWDGYGTLRFGRSECTAKLLDLHGSFEAFAATTSRRSARKIEDTFGYGRSMLDVPYHGLILTTRPGPGTFGAIL